MIDNCFDFYPPRFIDISPETVDGCNSCKKPYIISLSGLSLDDNMQMLEKAYQVQGVSAIELNLACPNVPGKPVIAYDFDQMEEVHSEVTKSPHFGKKPLGVKLAPYFDMPHFERAAKIIAKYPIRFVVSINTIGNALFVDAETECASISPKGSNNIADLFIF